MLWSTVYYQVLRDERRYRQLVIDFLKSNEYRMQLEKGQFVGSEMLVKWQMFFSNQVVVGFCVRNWKEYFVLDEIINFLHRLQLCRAILRVQLYCWDRYRKVDSQFWLEEMTTLRADHQLLALSNYQTDC